MTTNTKIGDKFVCFDKSNVYIATVTRRLSNGWEVDNPELSNVIYDVEIEEKKIDTSPLIKFESEQELLQLKLKYL